MSHIPFKTVIYILNDFVLRQITIQKVFFVYCSNWDVSAPCQVFNIINYYNINRQLKSITSFSFQWIDLAGRMLVIHSTNEYKFHLLFFITQTFPICLTAGNTEQHPSRRIWNIKESSSISTGLLVSYVCWCNFSFFPWYYVYKTESTDSKTILLRRILKIYVYFFCMVIHKYYIYYPYKKAAAFKCLFNAPRRDSKSPYHSEALSKYSTRFTIAQLAQGIRWLLFDRSLRIWMVLDQWPLLRKLIFMTIKFELHKV